MLKLGLLQLLPEDGARGGRRPWRREDGGEGRGGLSMAGRGRAACEWRGTARRRPGGERRRRPCGEATSAGEW